MTFFIVEDKLIFQRSNGFYLLDNLMSAAYSADNFDWRGWIKFIRNTVSEQVDVDKGSGRLAADFFGFL